MKNKTLQKQIIILSVVITILAILAGFLVWYNRDGGSFSFLSGHKNFQETKLVSRTIDGVLVPKGRENFFPYAVIIENHFEARPQSGINQANLVYEALTEGGITRFMAIFADGSEIKEI
ncbi:MAG: DUF3048 domain-containing protein, partial [bacterium]